MLTQKRLKELLHYNKLTGDFTWLVSSNRDIIIGDVAGCIDKTTGYWRIGIDGKLYQAHRLTWLYVHGYFPEYSLDHKDRIRHHNWTDNLRPISQQCNVRNTGNPSTNTSGVKGVSWMELGGKWKAQICISGKVIYLGLHSDFLEAACHRLAAEQAEDWSGCDSSSPAYQFVNNHLQGVTNNDEEALYKTGTCS